MKRHNRIAADAVTLTPLILSLSKGERLPTRYRGVYAGGSEAAERGRRALDEGWVAPASPPSSTPSRASS